MPSVARRTNPSDATHADRCRADISGHSPSSQPRPTNPITVAAAIKKGGYASNRKAVAKYAEATTRISRPGPDLRLAAMNDASAAIAKPAMTMSNDRVHQ